MIADFKPYMTTARLDGYQPELREIDAGVHRTDTSVAVVPRRGRPTERSTAAYPHSPRSTSSGRHRLQDDRAAWTGAGQPGQLPSGGSTPELQAVPLVLRHSWRSHRRLCHRSLVRPPAGEGDDGSLSSSGSDWSPPRDLPDVPAGARRRPHDVRCSRRSRRPATCSRFRPTSAHGRRSGRHPPRDRSRAEEVGPRPRRKISAPISGGRHPRWPTGSTSSTT